MNKAEIALCFKLTPYVRLCFHFQSLCEFSVIQSQKHYKILYVIFGQIKCLYFGNTERLTMYAIKPRSKGLLCVLFQQLSVISMVSSIIADTLD